MKHPTHIVAACALVSRPGGEVLLVKTSTRGWVVPGGQVEEGEGLIAALQREIFEEAGVETRIGSLVGICSNIRPPTKVVFSFLADWVAGEALPSDETPEVRWVSRSSVLERIDHPSEHDRARDMLEFDGTQMYRVISTRPYEVHLVRPLGREAAQLGG